MPTGGEWGPLKQEATKFAQDVGYKPVSPTSLLRHFIRVRSKVGGHPSGEGKAGAGRSGTGGGGGGSGTRSRSGAWQAGASAARNIGAFFSRVDQAGLAEALRESGLGDLVGRPASEISVALLDKLAGPGSTLDKQAARKALMDLNDEIFADAESFEDANDALSKVLDERGLLEILWRFFGFYLYEYFCDFFYERLLKKVGSAQVLQSLKSIKDCIESSVKAKLTARDVTGVDWQGDDGRRLSGEVLGEVLDIFELPA